MTAAAILVLATLPDRARAEGLAESLVRDRLAACVSIGASIRSIYHWRGKVETADEVVLTIKTRRECYRAVESAIRRDHPYELPEILAVPVLDGFAPYLDWIAAETAPPD
ncbi:MAG TPA: divalent-cation tolerance protein CutA [Casimicrobiaceae bacterium]|nr:divalent-cation tolerance protein CutA [Casimicrobiaceae bacterium]